MKVWLYYRLSRDEDEELNSLTNQRKIIYDFAMDRGYEIVGESFDDNVSGMHFNREGINKIYEAVENRKMEAVLVKDLSRLGRHRTQTALFIDYLRENNVRVLSATENIDTANENDDLIIGFKGIMNDFYARDIGRKVRTGFRQKQKDGLIMIAPFGYFKDKNTKQIIIVEEAAETVRMIFTLYVSGHGIKAIARILNEKKRKTPAQLQSELLDKSIPCTCPEISYRYIWINTTVKRVLQDEIYTGTLINHKSETNSINKTFRFTSEEEQYRHENFVPAIITTELWEQAQFLLSERNSKKVRAGHNQKVHRYTSLIQCKDCGCRFVAKPRIWDGREQVEYICNSYHRYGKGYCTPHRIHEELLDKLIYNELLSVKQMAQSNWESIQEYIKQWEPRQSNVEAQITGLTEKITCLESDIENILMERIHDKVNAQRYDRMIEKRESDISQAKEQIQNYRNMAAVVKQKQTQMKRDINLLDDILAKGGISEAHLRMLVDQIYIHEEDGKLDVEICLKAAFRTHYDLYDEFHNLVDRRFDIGRIADEVIA